MAATWAYSCCWAHAATCLGLVPACAAQFFFTCLRQAVTMLETMEGMHKQRDSDDACIKRSSEGVFRAGTHMHERNVGMMQKVNMAYRCARCGEFQANFSCVDECDACRMCGSQQDARHTSVAVGEATWQVRAGWAGPASP